MPESLKFISGTKRDCYESLLPQVQALVRDERDCIANLANVAAALKQQFDWLWIGFYLVRGDALVLGPFQGPVACTRIARGRGVCGTAWSRGETIVVPDVDQFPGHIACSSLSRSEIVVPLQAPGGIWGVLDADSAQLSTFDATDRDYLEKLVRLLKP